MGTGRENEARRAGERSGRELAARRLDKVVICTVVAPGCLCIETTCCSRWCIDTVVRPTPPCPTWTPVEREQPSLDDRVRSCLRFVSMSCYEVLDAAARDAAYYIPSSRATTASFDTATPRKHLGLCADSGKMASARMAPTVLSCTQEVG